MIAPGKLAIGGLDLLPGAGECDTEHAARVFGAEGQSEWGHARGRLVLLRPFSLCCGGVRRRGWMVDAVRMFPSHGEARWNGRGSWPKERLIIDDDRRHREFEGPRCRRGSTLRLNHGMAGLKSLCRRIEANGPTLDKEKRIGSAFGAEETIDLIRKAGRMRLVFRARPGRLLRCNPCGCCSLCCGENVAIDRIRMIHDSPRVHFVYRQINRDSSMRSIVKRADLRRRIGFRPPAKAARPAHPASKRHFSLDFRGSTGTAFGAT